MATVTSVVVTGVLSILVSRYVTRKLNELREQLKRNPLALAWGIINILSGPFFSSNNRITARKRAPIKDKRSSWFGLFGRNKALVDKKKIEFDENDIDAKNIEESDDESGLDSDVALISKTKRITVQAPPPSIDLTKLVANSVMGSIIGFEKIKNYVTADDIYQKQVARSDQTFSNSRPSTSKNIYRETVVV